MLENDHAFTGFYTTGAVFTYDVDTCLWADVCPDYETSGCSKCSGYPKLELSAEANYFTEVSSDINDYLGVHDHDEWFKDPQ